MLYPKMTESRMVFDLNGVWDFCLMDGEAKGEIVPMPVPSSYNDIYTGRGFADHVGNLYYRRTFTVSSRMLEKRLFLRFGSVTHKAEVWLNGTCLGKHSGGFLPFSFEITETAIAGENELEVIVNNIVDETTLPAGRMVHQKFPGLPEEIHNLPNFDFYNYSGIMRPVCLYTAPGSYIEDISIYGKMDGSFYWDVKANGEGTVSVRLLDAAGNEVAAGEGFKGTGRIDQVQLWEPGHPVLYSLEVTLTGSDGEKDTYTEVFGFREVSIRDCRIHLNGKPVYLKGFGKHEDSPVHGRGFDMAYNVKDIGLLKWIGANSFRTSHYPYCEEMLQLCDREGIKNGALKVLSFAVRTYLDPNCTEFTNGLLVDAISLLLKDTKAAMHGNPAAREHLHNAAALVGAACGSVLDTVTTDLPNFPTNEERPTGDNDIRCANLAEQLGFHDCRAFLANCDALAML